MRLVVFILLFFIPGINNHLSFANNVRIYNVSVTEKNTMAQWVNIRFDLQGDNLWRTTTGAENWCAIWVFVKYRLDDGDWQHASLSTNRTNHQMPEDVYVATVSDGKGVFLYAVEENIGDFGYNVFNLNLRWNYGLDGVADDATDIDIHVFGIEMVYVPQGSFYVGSGGTENNHFYTYPNLNTPYYIENEDVIQVGEQASYLYYNFDDDDQGWDEGGDQTGPIPAFYPKGYNAFYMMRYEISQEQYVGFLNTLTRVQQNNRVADISERYVLSSDNVPQNRNGVRREDPLPEGRVTFFCDLNDGVPNQADDGQNIPCNYLSWTDGLAYLDWAGLRPMTELEFEKACRGIVNPVADEYAWGSTDITEVVSILNIGQSNEIASNSGDGLCAYNETLTGALRSGFAATSSTNRIQSGSSYYNIQDLSGNLSERCISVGSTSGRSFTGEHGDGSIDVDGNADVANWPDELAYADRGGNYVRIEMRLRVSDRSRAVLNSNSRFTNTGWRGVRFAE